MRVSGFALCLTVLFGVGLTACSTMSIPTIVLRRLNDVGVIYKAEYSQAESAVSSVISEMGCSIRYVSRVPGTVKGQSVEEAGSMTIHCQCPGDTRYPKAFGFEVDVDRVSGHPDQRKIRIGIGDFGDKDMALRFHQLLMKKLQYIPEDMPKKHAESLTGKTAPQKNSAAPQTAASERTEITYEEVVITTPAKPVAVDGGMVEELEVIDTRVTTPVKQ